MDLPDLRASRWPQWGVGGRGDDRQEREMIGGKDHHREGIETHGGRISRERGRETRLGWGWEVALAEWNDMDITHGKHTCGNIGT